MGNGPSPSVVDGRFCRYLLGFPSPLVGPVVHRWVSVRDVLRDESRRFSPLKLLFSSGYPACFYGPGYDLSSPITHQRRVGAHTSEPNGMAWLARVNHCDACTWSHILAANALSVLLHWRTS